MNEKLSDITITKSEQVSSARCKENDVTSISTAHRDAKLKALFLLSLDGDKVSYESFLKGVSELIARYLNYYQHSVVLSKEHKEDILQNILLTIHKRKSSFNVNYPILPWVYALARNVVIDDRRGLKNKAIHELFNEDFCRPITDEKELLEHQISVRQEAKSLLASLKPEDRKALILTKMYGHSTEEVADELQISKSNLKVKIFRAIKFLKRRSSGNK